MPEGEKPLPAEQIDLFARWIRQGAKDDTPEEFKRTLVTKEPPTYTQPVTVTALAYSPDGTSLAVSGYREVLLHKPDGSGLQDRLVGLSERIEGIAFRRTGSVLLVAGGSAGRFGELQFWDWKERKLLRSVLPSYDTVYGAAFSADGKRVSFGCADNSARIIDAENGKQVLRVDHHLDWVFGTAFTLDGKHIVTASRDRTVKVCETDSGAFIGNLTTLDPTQASSSFAASFAGPDATNASPAARTGCRVCIASVTGNAGGSLPRRYEKLKGRVEGLAFSADGKQFAAGGVAAWSASTARTTGRAIASLTVPGTVFALAFRPDGKEIAVAGLDGKVRLFDLPAGKLVKEFVPVPLAPKP